MQCCTTIEKTKLLKLAALEPVLSERMYIPRIIHQVWIGPHPLPTIWLDSIKTQAYNCGYEYMLWREDTIAPVINETKLKSVFDALSPLAGKVDIARYAILFKYGGIYIDADTACVNEKSFRAFTDAFTDNNQIQTFIGLEPNGEKYTKEFHIPLYVANGIIGVTPQSAFMSACIKSIKSAYQSSSSWALQPPWICCGPVLVSRVLAESTKITSSSFSSSFAMQHRSFQGQTVAVIRESVFYPQSWHGINSITVPDVRFPKETIFFQFGYSTNNLGRFFDPSPPLAKTSLEGMSFLVLLILAISLVTCMCACVLLVRRFTVIQRAKHLKLNA